MVGNHHLAEAIIALLKSDADLTTYLDDRGAPMEIREHSYQGFSSTYPAVRVNINGNNMLGDGNCSPNQSTANVTIYAYSEKDSSYECDELTKVVFDACKDKRLDHTNFLSTVLTPSQLNHAQREVAQRRWRGSIQFSAILLEKEL